MHETDIHDLSDDADYAASQQQGSASIMRSDSGRQSSSSEPDGAEVVYSKDNVTIHPSQLASERISGRLKLIKQGSALFMTWIPYKGQGSNARLSEKDKNLYTIRAVPLTEVRSVRRHTPAFGWQYIIVVLSSGLAFPPLYFYNGGVKEFLATIKQHVFIVRSAEDANVFLINDFQNPLQRTLSSLELPRAVSVVSDQSVSIDVGESPLDESQESSSRNVRDGRLSTLQYNGRTRLKPQDPARDLSIHVLEKFSLVTKFARETTSQIFGETHNNGFGAIEKRRYNHQSSIDHPEKASNSAEKAPELVPVAADPLEKISCTKHNPGDEADTGVGCFELIKCEEFDEAALIWGKPRQPPLGPEEWVSFLDSEGRVTDSKALRKRIFYGGVEHILRKEVWAFLLGYHAYDSTYAEREYFSVLKKSEYETIKNQWQSISPEQAKRFTKFRERKGLIDKDVVRTDRSLPFYDGDDNPNVNILRDILLTYSFYNFDLGYCQLVELLDSPLHNYFKQQECLNYFFCFRWVLIQFKREFEYEKTMRLWEVLWTHYMSEHLHLYICVAILKRYRNKIMGEQMDFDTLLKFINELSGQIELDAVIRDAEALCICAGENGAASIPPGTPPSLPIDNGLLLYSQQDDEVL
ncbi:hypothetical protein F8388_004359 [Cannabis sativa]|uniref:Rab-GAP TBC domain-containing protein n=1 Tax=Cannabis sativa TaxID=3483 RepID=A0A7J6HC69_CANSA|nr:hypothetical protein G4B88_013569 [Cannabis sativa]KAF4392030.1 hypothetical protein F8388_004359 [Cannabis sativa]